MYFQSQGGKLNASQGLGLNVSCVFVSPSCVGGSLTLIADFDRTPVGTLIGQLLFGLFCFSCPLGT